MMMGRHHHIGTFGIFGVLCYQITNVQVQCRNSLSPFSSMQKVYWSPFFRENMDHKLKTSLWLRPYQEWECGPPMTQPLFKVPSSCRQKSLL